MRATKILDKILEHASIQKRRYIIVKFTGYTIQELITLYEQFDKIPEWTSHHLHDGSSIEDLTEYLVEFGNFGFFTDDKDIAFNSSEPHMTLEKASFVDLNVLYSL